MSYQVLEGPGRRVVVCTMPACRYFLFQVDTANCTDYKTWPMLPRLLLKRFEHSGSTVMKKPGHLVRLGDNFYRSGQVVTEVRDYAWTKQCSTATSHSLSASQSLCTAQVCCSTKVIQEAGVTEMPETPGLSQQGRFAWVTSTHSTRTALHSQPHFPCCCDPGGATRLRGAQRRSEDLRGGMLRRWELWLALLQEVD